MDLSIYVYKTVFISFTSITKHIKQLLHIIIVCNIRVLTHYHITITHANVCVCVCVCVCVRVCMCV